MIYNQNSYRCELQHYGGRKMKSMATLCLGVWLMMVSMSVAQDLSGLKLIAHYPLDQDSVDVTKNYPPMKLINTPFQEGGIYCNGKYIYGNQPGGSDAVTPEITGLNFKKFAIQARFKVSAYKYQPVLVAGHLYRWIGLYLSADSTVLLFYSGVSWKPSKPVRYSLNTWHQFTIVYDSTSQTGMWFLDGQPVDTVQFQLDHSNDKKISVTNYGDGVTFEGLFDDLKIYTLETPTGIGNSLPAGFELRQNFPNPFVDATTIHFALPYRGEVRLQVFDVLGREVASLIRKELPAGEHRFRFIPSQLPPGVYFYRLQFGPFLQQRKMILATSKN